MLAATELVLTHPVTGEELALKAPPEQSFMDVLSIFPSPGALNAPACHSLM